MADTGISLMAHAIQYPAAEGISTGPVKTLFLSFYDFVRREDLCRAYHEVLAKKFSAKEFSKQGKHDRIYSKTDWVVAGLDDLDQPVSFALIVELGCKWIIEYVMTNPENEGTGIGSAVTARIFHAAYERAFTSNERILFVVLDCKEHNVEFYKKKGLKVLATAATKG
jgi:hypothetical protein